MEPPLAAVAPLEPPSAVAPLGPPAAAVAPLGPPPAAVAPLEPPPAAVAPLLLCSFDGNTGTRKKTTMPTGSAVTVRETHHKNSTFW